MAEQDPLDQFEQTAKQLGSTIMELVKMRMQQQQQMQMQKDNQEHSARLAAEQNEKMVQGFKDALKEAGIAPTEKNMQLTGEQFDKLSDIVERETAAKDTIKDIDTRLDQIDSQQDAILNPKLEGQELADYKPDSNKLRELQNEKNGLKAQKGRLTEELDGLAIEAESVKNGKGLKGLEVEGLGKEQSNAIGGPKSPKLDDGGVQIGRGRSNAISGNSLKPQGLGGPDKLGVGVGMKSPDLGVGQERTFKPGSVGDTLKKQGYKIGGGPTIGLKQGQGVIKPKIH